MDRLNTIFSLIEPCNIFADIGTDHGLIARAACELCKKVIASDISEKCLQKAKKLLKTYDCAEFLVSDGLKSFDKKPCMISICGMGGHTIIDILEDYFLKDKTAKLILQPQNDAPLLREFLIKNNYSISCDIISKDGKKFYTIIKAIPLIQDADVLDSMQIMFGKFYKKKSIALKEKLQQDLARLLSYDTTQNQELINQTKEALSWQS